MRTKLTDGGTDESVMKVTIKAYFKGWIEKVSNDGNRQNELSLERRNGENFMVVEKLISTPENMDL